jgi:hypothetical protein
VAGHHHARSIAFAVRRRRRRIRIGHALEKDAEYAVSAFGRASGNEYNEEPPRPSAGTRPRSAETVAMHRHGSIYRTWGVAAMWRTASVSRPWSATRDSARIRPA